MKDKISCIDSIIAHQLTGEYLGKLWVISLHIEHAQYHDLGYDDLDRSLYFSLNMLR
jgi:hypothetical protein